jgi:predicted ATP-grasp superfamily ATP-dependent carboligase
MHVAGVEVVGLEATMDDEALALFARTADWSLVIAPELDGELLRLAGLVEECGGRLLGPCIEAIRLTSDKLALANHWREHGIPTPATTDRAPTTCEAFPVVLKPRDGAGSTATFLVRSALDLPRAQLAQTQELPHGEMIVQEYVAGHAVSAAFLCEPRGNVPLIPTFQLLDEFKYRGGELPIPPDLAARALRLGERAVECVPGLLGYVGVDLVLGDAADGSRDFAIEINPRLTTSYVGLRALAEFNLAEMMIRAATGKVPAVLKWKPGRVRFGADGSVAAG